MSKKIICFTLAIVISFSLGVFLGTAINPIKESDSVSYSEAEQAECSRLYNSPCDDTNTFANKAFANQIDVFGGMTIQNYNSLQIMREAIEVDETAGEGGSNTYVSNSYVSPNNMEKAIEAHKEVANGNKSLTVYDCGGKQRVIFSMPFGKPSNSMAKMYNNATIHISDPCKNVN